MNDLTNRLRGRYAIGPDGEYGERDFSKFIPAISLEAADRIESLVLELGLLEISHETNRRHLESCETALAERDELLNGKRWASAANRLPDSCGCYLVFIGGSTVAWSFYNSEQKWCSGNEYINGVTHWMPLPAPPINKG